MGAKMLVIKRPRPHLSNDSIFSPYTCYTIHKTSTQIGWVGHQLARGLSGIGFQRIVRLEKLVPGSYISL